ncbi:uncharacterized protein BJ171DRAFT_488687 [Polychytrium aggregatum]|uniref:uncharacterized protein n=1 Tax=Polychytrium aggregatum TaxID=110093 RepID=UPI0022FF0B53|nr:uncharacterized protein BJ171DRAFT_488687 [Polychytrium aggregatum]KAI9209162.1 hypothetical protein BJ171DRAFT_488687 [Polychytrium aggregatum]
MVCWLESLLYKYCHIHCHIHEIDHGIEHRVESCILAKARCNSHSIQFHIDCDALAPACCTEHHQFASKPSFPHRNMLTVRIKQGPQRRYLPLPTNVTSHPLLPHTCRFSGLVSATKVAQAIVLHHKDCNRLQMGVYQGTPCSYQASPRCLLFDRLYGPR